MLAAARLLLPWNFSPTVLVAVAAAAVLYARGTAHGSRLGSGVGQTFAPTSICRRLAFGLGVALVYAALQTCWEYYASHMMFVLQLQHFTLHDLAPALMVWSAPWATLAGGLPPRLAARAHFSTRALRGLARLALNPWIATAVYLAALLVWLWPPVTFAVMLSNPLYELMSWSVLAGGLPFWVLVLDPRPYPQARARPGERIVMLHIAMTAIVLAGASMTLSSRDWYPVYAVCGRFLPITAIADQELGGAVMWVLGALIFAPAFLIVVGRNLEHEEAAAQCAAGPQRSAGHGRAVVGAAAPSLAKPLLSK